MSHLSSLAIFLAVLLIGGVISSKAASVAKPTEGPDVAKLNDTVEALSNFVNHYISRMDTISKVEKILQNYVGSLEKALEELETNIKDDVKDHENFLKTLESQNEIDETVRQSEKAIHNLLLKVQAG